MENIPITEKHLKQLKVSHLQTIKHKLIELIEHKQRILGSQQSEIDKFMSEFQSHKQYSQVNIQFTKCTTQEIIDKMKLAESESQSQFEQNLKNIEQQVVQLEQQEHKMHEVETLLKQRTQQQIQLKISELKYQELVAGISNNTIQLQQQAQLKDQYEFAIQQQIQKQNNGQQEIKEIENQKRYWNNLLQEAKGSVRVYCRIRPVEQKSDMIQVVGDCSICLKVPEKFIKSANCQKENYFNFEHIFNEEADQEEIYNELSQLVQNVVDGHNVCIFAYGQTGSGKTHTMQGNDTISERGVIPRAVEHIFKELYNMIELGWKAKVRVGFQEIYNETIKDLISNQKCDDIQLFDVKDQFEVAQLFNSAKENRKVAETLSNEFSSRSHFIFQLNLNGISGDKQINSTLNLVDLAGSERANVAKTEGDRFIETKSINKSLSSLGDVFNALFNKQTFVPYRNSKLTFVLQKYLEGTSKTLMMVNVSPRLDDFNQTLASLRFAEKVKSCKMQIQQQQQPQQAKK